MEATMTFTGLAGRSPELRHTATGIPTVTFRVGTTPRIKTVDGWDDGTTTWINVVCYRALAEHTVRSVVKGDPVIVQGRVRTQTWADSDGVVHEKMVVEASAIGHDFTRGVAVYLRPRDREVPPPEAAGEPAADDLDESSVDEPDSPTDGDDGAETTEDEELALVV